MAKRMTRDCERRRYPRGEVQLPLQFFQKTGDNRLAGITINIGRRGLLAECARFPDFFLDLLVRIHIGVPPELWEEQEGYFEGRVRRVERGARSRCAVEAVGDPPFLLFPELVGKHHRLLDVKRKLVDIVSCNANVLIQGETGTGKNVVAKLIHQYSARSNSPFVRQNCPSTPETLLESQFFGHEKGAFTDAKSARPGVFRLAHRGTIVLDEISALPCSLQAKLLQTIEEKKFFPIGGSREVEVDVRIIATTNDDLEEMMRKGTFRKDLFYRLNELSVTLPALRDSKSDIPLLADYFLRKYSSAFGRVYRPCSKSWIEMFQNYPWPGNVRELENMIKRSILIGRWEALEGVTGRRNRSAEGPMKTIEQLRRQAADAEKLAILRAVEFADHNRTRAAAALGISYRTLLRKIKIYGIEV